MSRCPLCALDVEVIPGLVIEQRPSGDVVCGICAEIGLEALYDDLWVLREDHPPKFSDIWPRLEQHLAGTLEGELDLSRLLASLRLQRNPLKPLRAAGRGPHPPVSAA